MTSRADYERAEQFLPDNTASLVRNEKPDIHWIAGTDRFWYVREREDGREFIRVDSATGACSEAFDHQRLANSLSDTTETEVDSRDLPFEEFEYVEQESAIRFQVQDQSYRCDLSTYECEMGSAEEEVAGRSPDDRWVVFTENHDLYVRNTRNQEEIQLTADGHERYGYAKPYPSPVEMVDNGSQDIEQDVEVSWSPDSQWFMTYRLDRRSANQFALVQSSPDDRVRPKHYLYDYPLPGEVGVPTAEPIVVNVEQRTVTELDVEPIPLLYYGSEPLFDWDDDSYRLYYLRRSRGFDSVQFIEANPHTGETRSVFRETSDTLVDPRMSSVEALEHSDEAIWTSEKSGWHHLYLIDRETGEGKQQITSGDWVVREVKFVDEESRTILFTASGREDERDPYLRHFYRVNFDGSDLALLTPEPADHSISVSPTGEFFVDTYSTVDTEPVTVLRRSVDGTTVRRLEEADASELYDLGWTPPVPFEATAVDDETDLYGILWRPSEFDESERYPVVEHIYTGPHNHFVPKSFDAYQSMAQAIAELGFIVVMIDGRGTGRRSKSFRDCSYKNLSRDGIEDHKAAIRQLADELSYLDLDRIGIYGHSAGGYDSARALFQHSDFYDAAVSSSGNHDHRLDKASWNEMWMGYPVEEHYGEQSNIALADQLEGELLLVHGELDQNVHPAATLRLADELIEHNKDFDMLILPNEHHSIDDNPYFIRRRWDFLVEHVMDENPPKEYDISSY